MERDEKDDRKWNKEDTEEALLKNEMKRRDSCRSEDEEGEDRESSEDSDVEKT